MTASKHKPFVRRFIEKQRRHFEHALAAFPEVVGALPGYDKWTEGNKAYYRHAIATCAFMLKQLEHYRDSPYFPPDNRKRGA